MATQELLPVYAAAAAASEKAIGSAAAAAAAAGGKTTRCPKCTAFVKEPPASAVPVYKCPSCATLLLARDRPVSSSCSTSSSPMVHSIRVLSEESMSSSTLTDASNCASDPVIVLDNACYMNSPRQLQQQTHRFFTGARSISRPCHRRPSNSSSTTSVSSCSDNNNYMTGTRTIHDARQGTIASAVASAGTASNGAAAGFHSALPWSSAENLDMSDADSSIVMQHNKFRSTSFNESSSNNAYAATQVVNCGRRTSQFCRKLERQLHRQDSHYDDDRELWIESTSTDEEEYNRNADAAHGKQMTDRRRLDLRFSGNMMPTAAASHGFLKDRSADRQASDVNSVRNSPLYYFDSGHNYCLRNGESVQQASLQSFKKQDHSGTTADHDCASSQMHLVGCIHQYCRSCSSCRPSDDPPSLQPSDQDQSCSSTDFSNNNAAISDCNCDMQKSSYYYNCRSSPQGSNSNGRATIARPTEMHGFRNTAGSQVDESILQRETRELRRDRRTRRQRHHVGYAPPCGSSSMPQCECSIFPPQITQAAAHDSLPLNSGMRQSCNENGNAGSETGRLFGSPMVQLPRSEAFGRRSCTNCDRGDMQQHMVRCRQSARHPYRYQNGLHCRAAAEFPSPNPGVILMQGQQQQVVPAQMNVSPTDCSHGQFHECIRSSANNYPTHSRAVSAADSETSFMAAQYFGGISMGNWASSMAMDDSAAAEYVHMVSPARFMKPPPSHMYMDARYRCDDGVVRARHSIARSESDSFQGPAQLQESVSDPLQSYCDWETPSMEARHDHAPASATYPAASNHYPDATHINGEMQEEKQHQRIFNHSDSDAAIHVFHAKQNSCRPPYPGPGAPPYVLCQGCHGALRIPESHHRPDALPVQYTGTAVQKLQCSACRKISRFHGHVHAHVSDYDDDPGTCTYTSGNRDLEEPYPASSQPNVNRTRLLRTSTTISRGIATPSTPSDQANLKSPCRSACLHTVADRSRCTENSSACDIYHLGQHRRQHSNSINTLIQEMGDDEDCQIRCNCDSCALLLLGKKNSAHGALSTDELGAYAFSPYINRDDHDRVTAALMRDPIGATSSSLRSEKDGSSYNSHIMLCRSRRDPERRRGECKTQSFDERCSNTATTKECSESMAAGEMEWKRYRCDDTSVLQNSSQLSPATARAPLIDHLLFHDYYDASEAAGNRKWNESNTSLQLCSPAPGSALLEHLAYFSKETLCSTQSEPNDELNCKGSKDVGVAAAATAREGGGEEWIGGEDERRRPPMAKLVINGSLLRRSFKELGRRVRANSMKHQQEQEQLQRMVVVNGQQIPDTIIKRVETQAGPIHPGTYWYDYQAGFWGVIGGPCLGIIPPFIEEFNFPLARDCAAGETGILLNGRELHKKDLHVLMGRGFPSTPNMSYTVDIRGHLIDIATGKLVRDMGKLAPSMERRGRGYGMFQPNLQS